MKLTDSSSARVGGSAVNAIASATTAFRHFLVYTTASVSSAITGAIGLVKNGAGILNLSGTNTYSGNTSVNSGVLSIATTGSLPGFSSSGRYSVAANAGLAVGNSVTDSEVGQILGTSNFATNASFGFDTTNGNRTYSAGISGARGLVKLGLNTLTLGAAHTYTGKTLVKQGTLATTAANQIPDASEIEVESGATFQLGGNDSVFSIAGAGTINIGANTLTVAGAGTANFAGSLTNTTGRFVKSGSGSQTLSGLSSITQDLTHTGGTLVFAGTFTSSKDFELCRGTAVSPANCTITGTLTQTGFGAQAAPRCFTVAQNGYTVGTLTFSSPANVNLYGGLMIGDNQSTGSVGAIVINGGTIDTGIQGATWLSGPSATITVNGGTYTTNQIWLSGGHATTNPTPVHTLTLNEGTVDLRGNWNGTSILPNQAQITFGTSTAGVTLTATLNLNGGTLRLNHISCTAGATGGWNYVTVNFNGGTYDYFRGFNGRSFPNNVPARTTWSFIIKGGGANISVYSGATLTMNVAFSNDGGNGGLTKLGLGTLAMGSLAHSYNGATNISLGIITASKTASGVTATGTFGISTLAVSFSASPPSGTTTFRFFPGSTTNTYASVTLTGVSVGTTASYNSANSTLSVTAP